MTAVWWCAYSQHEAENTAARSFRDMGFPVFFPRIRQNSISRGVPVVRLEALFTRYLFIQGSAEEWKLANYARGVKQILGAETGSPFVVHDAVIAEIKSRCDENDFYADEVSKISAQRKSSAVAPGELGVVVEGPLAGMRGICTLSSHKRVSIMLQIFGRQGEVHFQPQQVSVA